MGDNPTETVDVDGLTDSIPAQVVLNAADELLEGDDTTDGDRRQYLEGGVLFRCDGYDTDADVDIYVPEHDDKATVVGLANLRDGAERAVTPDFETFVRDEFDVEVLADTAYMSSDIDVTTTQNRDTFGERVGRAFDRSDDVEVTYISFGENGGGVRDSAGRPVDERQLRIGLEDIRDE
jgi:hypothetical protein